MKDLFTEKETDALFQKLGKFAISETKESQETESQMGKYEDWYDLAEETSCYCYQSGHRVMQGKIDYSSRLPDVEYYTFLFSKFDYDGQEDVSCRVRKEYLDSFEG